MERTCAVCGETVNDQAVICPHCGCVLDEEKFNAVTAQNLPVETAEEANLILKILSALLPLIGLILFVVNYADRRHIANTYGIWALCGVAVRINLYIYAWLFSIFITFLLMLVVYGANADVLNLLIQSSY